MSTLAPTDLHPPTTADAPPPVAMMQLITGAVWITKAIYVAARLGLADLVAAEPRTAAALAHAVNADATALQRVLRALASVGIFAADDAGRFQLTPLAATLQSDVPGSLTAMAVLWGEPWHWAVWGSFLHGIQTGETPWPHATGQDLFAYFGAHPEHALQFDAAMSSFSGQEAHAVAAAYDFANIASVLDVGGGQGLLLATILQANPALHGVVVDLPHLAISARQLLNAAGVADRADFASGDFFSTLPVHADACILKNILHDFDDARAIAILEACHQALPPGGKLLVIQEALPAGNAPSVGKLLDLQMLLIGGQERTAAEYRALFVAAGFDLSRIIPTQSPLHIIEGVAKPRPPAGPKTPTATLRLGPTH